MSKPPHDPMGDGTEKGGSMSICDKCGHRTPNVARAGYTCNNHTPSGYCDGTMRTPVELAQMRKAEEQKGLETVLGTSAQEFAADTKPVKARRKK